MILEVAVFKESIRHFRADTARNRPARDAHVALFMDLSNPPKHRLESLYDYYLTDEEVLKYWGKLEGHTVQIGCTQIMNGQGKPSLRGEIIAVK